ncbi:MULTISPECIES: sugar-binding domain-containing protein [unclassified Chelatococcus]|uniref:sugar-binding transcriptional regulator n=1 Tax=unclassified Chelatococcus TaxID=2638111 RepID=UPI001BCF7DAB|nr:MULTISPECIES: sugar-binding domain-containing protein [unclassified Chelatococcus]CAH1658006.1 SmoC-like regulatory protein [Hyphomicrobiales bacterium]MBS7742230.1 sugar-binding transcriptional regulator [Chelatococcus sp. HY11]MBX3542652.1 sugar-binding transcriptional regulator [Chelatococcus sp.]MCO5075132.1 sugar-binding transcriptional regulator [Chelatococcus sp.]CAH1689513.1 SmoC-like regulatory protein [Hyphomicrobiales bacterium]
MTPPDKDNHEPARGEALPLGGGEESRLQLATRVAWMYFIEGLKQEDIAVALGISRMRVNRLLAAARDEGLVRIDITSPFRSSADCEGRLRAAFGLREVVLAPTASKPDQIDVVVGHALGSYLNGRLANGMTVGVHHGRSPHAMFQGLKPAVMPDTAIVALKGSLSAEGRMAPYETVARLALTLQASCYQLAAPSYARTTQEHELFTRLPMVEAVMRRAAACDLAILTASRITDDGGLVGYGYISPAEAKALRERGAVGAVLGTFIDADGQVIDHELNHRQIGLGFDDLAAVPEVILTGAGPGKVLALRAALTRRLATVFVTDEQTAEQILAA